MASLLGGFLTLVWYVTILAGGITLLATASSLFSADLNPEWDMDVELRSLDQPLQVVSDDPGSKQ